MVNESKDRTQFLTNKKKHKGKGLSFFTEAAMFESFHIRDFRWFWFGTFANFMAIGMQIMARSWLVLRLSDDSPLALSMVMVAFSLPMTVMALLGGALADRFPKKYIIMATQAVNALMTSLLATLDLTGLVRFWHLIVFGVVNGSLMAINVPSRQAIISDMLPQEKVMNAISLNNSGMNLTRAVGPALAGVLIVYINTAGVFYLISAFSVFAMFSVGMIRTTKRAADNARKSMIQDISAGLKYAFRDSNLLGLCITLCMPVFFGFTIMFLLPSWAREALNVQSDDLGLLMLSMGMGSLVGSLALAAIRSISKRGTWVLVNGFLWGIAIVLFSKTDSYATALPFLFLIGLMMATFTSLHMTLMQIYSTDEMRGRIVSIGLMSFGAMPLSVLPFGAIAEKIGTPNALFLSGLMLVVFGLIFALFNPKFFRIE
jgi:MFS family permease